VDFYRTTRRYESQNSSLPNHRCENLESSVYFYAIQYIVTILRVGLQTVYRWDTAFIDHVNTRLIITLFRLLTQTSVVSLLQSPIAISWQRILTHEP
jgi:hypothetical protein